MHLYLVSNTDYFRMTVATTLFKWPTFSSFVVLVFWFFVYFPLYLQSISRSNDIFRLYQNIGKEELSSCFKQLTILLIWRISLGSQNCSRLTLVNWTGMMRQMTTMMMMMIVLKYNLLYTFSNCSHIICTE